MENAFSTPFDEEMSRFQLVQARQVGDLEEYISTFTGFASLRRRLMK